MFAVSLKEFVGVCLCHLVHIMQNYGQLKLKTSQWPAITQAVVQTKTCGLPMCPFPQTLFHQICFELKLLH